MRGFIAVLVLLAVGCGSPTTLILDVRMKEGEPAPASLLVSVYDRSGALTLDYRIKQPPPGKILILDLPARDQMLRAVIKGVAAGELRLGGTVIAVKARRQTTAVVELAASTTDADLDTVPDAVDNCPMVANLDQLDTTGSGVGDACSTLDMAVDPILDLDLAINADLASNPPQADFSGVTLDLTQGPVDLTVSAADLARAADLANASMQDLKSPPGADLLSAAPACTGSTRTRCEDFDSGSLAAWNVSQNNATVTTVTPAQGHVYRGARALKITTPGGGAFSGGIGDTGIVSALTTGFFVRAYVYLASPNIDYAQVFEAYPMLGGVGNQLSHDGRFVTMQDYGYGGANLYVNSTTRWPLDQWFCVEWQVQRGASTSAGAMRTWLNDVELTDVAAVPTDVGALDALFIGYTSDRTTTATIFLDELIVDDARIGCAE